MHFEPPLLNLVSAWIGLLLGMLSGAILGLGFGRETFLGGYGSWSRRLCRLGHISFFGLALVNFLFHATVRLESLGGPYLPYAGILLVVGAVTMPVLCFAAAFWRPARHAFAIPVLSLLAGVSLTLAGLVKL